MNDTCSVSSSVPRQARLPLHVEVRTVMVDIGAWRQALQCDAESVLARVDNGQIRWAFNIAVNLDSRRDLRFYATELIAPEIAAKLTLDQVIMGIIGQGEAVRTGRMGLLASNRPCADQGG